MFNVQHSSFQGVAITNNTDKTVVLQRARGLIHLVATQDGGDCAQQCWRG